MHYWFFPIHLISLHIRSMWETICDALHIPVARNFGSKFLECPHSSISGMLVWGTHLLDHQHPPPLELVSGSSYVETNWCIPRGYHLVHIIRPKCLHLAKTRTFVPQFHHYRECKNVGHHRFKHLSLFSFFLQNNDYHKCFFSMR